jgi:hypothetical protein
MASLRSYRTKRVKYFQDGTLDIRGFGSSTMQACPVNVIIANNVSDMMP